MDDVRPWDRQPGETSKAYEAFVTYRDLGSDRSIQRVSNELGKNRTTVTQWSSRWGWVERVEAWDSIPGRAVAEAHAEMAKRIAEQHERLATKLMAKLEKNVDLLPDGADPTVRFSTALGAARQSHQFATDLSRPEDTAKAAITEAIEKLIGKLAGEE